jgi:EpsD family peptidyl-prolyl cis-trans isomerase
MPGKNPVSRIPSSLFFGMLAMLLTGVLAGCSKEAKRPGQALVKVNGEEITAYQLNSELQRAGVLTSQQEAARAQLLESLIDRQLLQDAAAREELDRSPEVVQAIERAKASIIAQAYIQKRLQLVARPSKDEIEAYFSKNSDRFLHRQQFDLRQLVLTEGDSTDIAERAMKNADTIEEAAVWLKANHVQFGRNEVSRTSTDLSPELVNKLKAMPVGRLFAVNQDGRAALMTVTAVKDVPVDLQVAASDIEHLLANVKYRDATAAELARLRAKAKIEYLNNAAGSKKSVIAETTGKSSTVVPVGAGSNIDLK